MVWFLFFLIILLIIEVINMQKKLDTIVKVVDEIFEEKQKQINDLYNKINKEDNDATYL